jgi:hypothetical protein
VRDLLATLLDRDIGDLRAIAERWGVEPGARDQPGMAAQLADTLLQPAELADFVAGLPPQERQALEDVQAHQGRVLLSEAEHRFGEWRRMGPARRDRLQPHRQPIGGLEGLAYTGLIGRAFAESPRGPQEYVYVPQDLRSLLPSQPALEAYGERAPAPTHIQPAIDSGPEDAATLLGALRRHPLHQNRVGLSGWIDPLRPFLFTPQAAELLVTLMRELDLASGDPLTLDSDSVRGFLEEEDTIRPALLGAWRRSTLWNDLSAVPGLSSDDRPWPNDPLAARVTILESLAAVTPEVWWNLDSWVDAFYKSRPGFLRRAGDFDAWYLRDSETGSFLRGYESWHKVEGALLRWIVIGPLHWLGACDLGGAAPGGQAVTFRLTAAFGAGEAARISSDSGRPSARLQADGTVTAPAGMPLAKRYQLARILSWESRRPEGFTYRLTPSSLVLASRQHLRPTQVIALLEAAVTGAVPPHLRRAIERCAERGDCAHTERQLVLRASSPAILRELRNHRGTSRYLGEAVGEDGAIIDAKDWGRLRTAALQLGILIDDPPSTKPAQD